MKAKFLTAALAVTVAGSFGFSQAALAGDVKLPTTMAWSAYGTTSSGYAQAVAIGNMLKNKHGTSIRVLPGKNDVSRMTPLRDRKIDFCACGAASYFGQEGVGLFAKPDWGPQRLQLLMMSIATFGLGVASAKDAGISSPADLKGKRVAWVRGADALNVPTTGILAFGGLSWADVEKVEFPGFKASVDGIINDQVDAAFMSTVTPHAKRLAASPRGIQWPVLSHGDAEAWVRLKKKAPYYQPLTATSGAEISKQAPWQGGGYPYPILVSNSDKSEETVYSLVKAMVEGFDDFKDAAPGAAGWAIGNQNLTWALPFHTGAIKYFKEAGIWTDAAEAHNNALLKRQDALAAAWDAFMATNPAKDGFKAAWMAARAEALTKAGMDPVFK